MNKLKVCIICHFSNSKVREHLPLGNRKVYSFFRKVLDLPTKGVSYGDIAGWDTYMIELLRKRNDIELYVISAHSGLRRRKCSFVLEGVHYYFVRCDEATALKHIISSPSLWHKMNPMRPIVHRIIKSVRPDLIALIGAENPYIAGTVLGIKGIPLIVKCQTIYNNPDRRKFGEFDDKNAYVERLIFKDLRYVSVATSMHCRLFREINTTAFNLCWNLGNLLPEVKQVEKEYDFVNFAMAMIPKKGYPDAIRALAIVREHYPNVRLNLVGGGSKEDKEALQSLAKKLHLEGNVVFTPFFEKQEDLFQHIQKACFAVLPCKMDFISSTIRQAMHYGLPVVCYKTEGTSKINVEKDCVLIAENSDVEDLAKQMIKLMEDESLAMELRNNAKAYATRWNDDEGNSNQMSRNFHAVVENYYHSIPIPEELLCKENHEEKTNKY